ncbi:protein tesmin/TSO1-like CXC 2 isoform X2 [Mangifera indica]|uniref:protein tesmin/TSO1-like CXC 2 isoform X2 n=1 Tax=Mangifera indica TaxID=29780 RepID=UPI001CF9D3C1|nr:protein tesmin/TSO1-like CXC 2 isoform X2 [Mangifera indica]
MDTPDKSRLTATSLSKFEDSPVFNYINCLSPIEPVKSTHTGHSLNLLNFTSPSSAFASPQISTFRESRVFPKSNQSPEPLKPELPFSGNEIKPSEGDSEVAQPFVCCGQQLGCLAPENSAREVIAEPLNEPFGLAIELSKTMKYGCSSPVSNRASHEVMEKNKELEMAGGPFFQSYEDLTGTRHFEPKINLRKILRIRQSEAVAESDWSSLITDVSDIVNSNPSIVEYNFKEQDQRAVDTGVASFISAALHPPQDNSNDLEQNVSSSPSGSCQQNDIMEAVTQTVEIGELKDLDQTPDFLSSSLLNKLVVSDSITEVDDKGEKCDLSSCKFKIRRRCLVFEKAGGLKKQAEGEPNCSSSIQLQSDHKVACGGKQLIPCKRESDCSSSTLPGLGLHLNALASASNIGKIIKCQTLPSGRQLISLPPSISSVSSVTSTQNLNESSNLNSMERDSVLCDHEFEVMEKALQTCPSVGGEEFDHSDPKRKRYKPEPADESKACKRCNCKRSKCLKLYCECFAASLYCIEPCSCLDCFNKPIHEDTVMETRRQIESRNPLAFAPKVIRSIDSVTEYGDENNNTPASARHKSGCNCRKSSCLKKYCECFQGGVGCSISCRCEGCKNAFGRKDGADETEEEGEESESSEKNESDINSTDNVVKNGEEEYPDIVMIPSDVTRGKRSGSSLSTFGPPKLPTSIKLPTSNHLHQPMFETHLQVVPEDEIPKNLESDCTPTGGVQLPSPNCKRILPTGSSKLRYRTRRLTLRQITFPSTSPRETQ